MSNGFGASQTVQAPTEANDLRAHGVALPGLLVDSFTCQRYRTAQINPVPKAKSFKEIADLPSPVLSLGPCLSGTSWRGLQQLALLDRMSGITCHWKPVISCRPARDEERSNGSASLRSLSVLATEPQIGRSNHRWPFAPLESKSATALRVQASQCGASLSTV